MNPSSLLSVFGPNITAMTYGKLTQHSHSPQKKSNPTKSPSPAVKPKRPLSAYNLFFQAERKRVQASLPSNAPKIAFTEMAKIISKKWKVVDQGYKSYLTAQARVDKMRYDQAMKKYREQLAEEVAFLQEQEGPPTLVEPAQEDNEPEEVFEVDYFVDDTTFKAGEDLELPPRLSNKFTREQSIAGATLQPFRCQFSCANGVPPLSQMEQDPVLEMMTRPTNTLPDSSIQGLANQLDDEMKNSIIALFQ